MANSKSVTQFNQLREMIREALSESKGCEWVKSKSIQDIAAYTLEETYELIDALENKNSEAVKDELADLLFHVVLYGEMADKKGDFSLEDILINVPKTLKEFLNIKKTEYDNIEVVKGITVPENAGNRDMQPNGTRRESDPHRAPSYPN